MKEKLAKKEFIKNFEYFKRNRDEYNKKKKPLGDKVWMWVVVPFIVSYIPLVVLPFFLIPIWYFYIISGLFIIVVIGLISMGLAHDFKNMKAITFDNMVYTGKLSDLFEDVTHPVIVNAKHLLELDFKRKGGITGSTVFYLYEKINNPEYAVATVNLKSSDEKVTMASENPEEIENK